MGCATSVPKRTSFPSKRRKSKKGRINEVAVFVPAFQVPMPVDFLHPLRGLVSRELIDKVFRIRSRIVSLAEQDGVWLTCFIFSFLFFFFSIHFMVQAEVLQDLAVSHDVSELDHALEEYLPVLLGLTVKGIFFLQGLVVLGGSIQSNLNKLVFYRTQS